MKDIKYYSISKKLKRENKISEEFEVMLNNLSLEEAIALKLELASKVVKGKLYGLNIYNNLPMIAKDAAVKYAISACKTKQNAAALLGISYRRLKQLQSDYNIYSYFEKEGWNLLRTNYNIVYGVETVSTGQGGFFVQGRGQRGSLKTLKQ